MTPRRVFRHGILGEVLNPRGGWFSKTSHPMDAEVPKNKNPGTEVGAVGFFQQIPEKIEHLEPGKHRCNVQFF